MTPLEILKNTIRDLLLEKDGDIPSEDLVEIKRRAKDTGLDERQLNRLIQEVDAGINWESIKKQKEEAQKKEGELKKDMAQQRKNEQNAEETLNFILEQCAKDKVFEINEVKVFFETAHDLNQDENDAANLLKDYFDRNNYIPFTTPKGRSLKESLASTPWYKDKLPAPPPPPPSPPKPFPWKIALTGVVLLLAVGSTLFYFTWYKPRERDRNAKHMFCISNDLALRSSPQSAGNSNFVQKIEYGSEVLVYDTLSEWSPVKLVLSSKEGYCSTKFLLTKRDFYILNSIFADNETREAIGTSKCRKAVLDYFNRNNIIGKIDSNLQKEIFGVNSNKEVYQIFSKGRNIKPNTVVYDRYTNSSSKFTDFGFMVKNVSTNKRKFVLYSFTDDETPVFVAESEAPETGDIKSVRKSVRNGGLTYEPQYVN